MGSVAVAVDAEAVVSEVAAAVVAAAEALVAVVVEDVAVDAVAPVVTSHRLTAAASATSKAKRSLSTKSNGLAIRHLFSLSQ